MGLRKFVKSRAEVPTQASSVASLKSCLLSLGPCVHSKSSPEKLVQLLSCKGGSIGETGFWSSLNGVRGVWGFSQILCGSYVSSVLFAPKQWRDWVPCSMIPAKRREMRGSPLVCRGCGLQRGPSRPPHGRACRRKAEIG